MKRDEIDGEGVAPFDNGCLMRSSLLFGKFEMMAVDE
jgi:hypothetical protein